MLPKSARLGAAQVRSLIKTGRSARVQGLSAKYEASIKPHMAVVVSKKVAPGAVQRNRLRRLVYASLPTPLPPVNMVLFVQSPGLTPSQVATLCSQLS